MKFRIAHRLQALLPDNLQRLREDMDILEILSTNRDLKTHIKEAGRMLTKIDVERLPSYERGMERGESQLLHRLLQGKFCDLPPELAQRFDTASRVQLETRTDRLLGARELAEVFAAPAYDD